ncbi:MAG TPA: hypothetical protein PKW56_01020 [Clostridiales bacterium]|mgnify:CR=1 FL=1|nr:hypothetical protein [Clostridiales bacterium]
MKVLRYLAIFLVIILVAGCAKEKTDIPLKKVTLTKLHTIEGYTDNGQDSLNSISVFRSIFHYGNNNDLFLYDYKSGSVKAFDNKGEFKVSFGNKGMGPEEIESFNTFFTFRDTIFIVDSRTKIKKFSTDGSLLEIIPITSEIMSLPQHCYQINDSTIIGQVTKFIREPDKLTLMINLAIMDTDFKIRKTVYSRDVDYRKEGHMLSFFNPVYTFDKNRIYVTNMSKTDYKIQVFSLNGEYLKTIKKNYVRTRFSKEEMEILETGQKNTNPYFDKFYDYKVSIRRLATDKYGYLWVQRGDIETKITFDIFNEEKQIAEFTYDLKKTDGNYSQKAIEINNRLYVYDYDENLIDVYDYEIEN